MVYEKKKMQEMFGKTGVAQADCVVCDRPKSDAVCATCAHFMRDVRVRRRCDVHPNAIFTMDMWICPKCKGRQILEFGVDDVPEHLRPRPQPPPPSTLDQRLQHLHEMRGQILGGNVVKESPVSGMTPIQGSSTSNTVAPTAQAGSRPNAKRSRLNLSSLRTPVSPPAGTTAGSSGPSSWLPTPPTSPGCICDRAVTVVFCTSCGWCDASGIKKYMPCTHHPSVKGGFKECPQCGAESAMLEEQD